MSSSSPATVAALSALTASSSSSKTITSERNQQERWLVVDFDGTCTVRDTTPLLHRLAYLIESQSHNIDDKDENSTRLQLDLKKRLSTFSKLENEYYQGYIEVLRSIESEEYNDDNNNNDNNMLQLESSLHRFDCVSNSIIEKVNISNILRGLGTVSHRKLLEMIQNYQRKQEQDSNNDDDDDDDNGDIIFEENLRDSLQLHPGCLSVLRRQHIENNNWKIGVLSINWCPTLIEAVLLYPLCEKSCTSLTVPNIEEIPIWSNTIDENGVVSLVVPGAIAKKERILKLQQQQQNNSLVVYVGDSSTDLLAIIQADVGILLNGSTSTTRLALKYGVTIRSLNDYSNYDDDDDKNECSMIKKGSFDNGCFIWTASNWEEIGSFLNHSDDRLISSPRR